VLDNHKEDSMKTILAAVLAGAFLFSAIPASFADDKPAGEKTEKGKKGDKKDDKGGDKGGGW
jgi:hypothetical protein